MISLRNSLLILALGMHASTSSGQVIVSANINTAGASDNSSVNGAETFGVGALGTVVGNWNNFNFNRNNLIDSSGAATTVNATITNPGGYQFSGAAYIHTPLNYGPSQFSGTPDSPGTTLSFSNLNANFPQGYYAIVYLTGGTANRGALITDGDATFYYQTANPASLPATLVQATTTTDLGDGNAPIAQYAVFGSTLEPLTSDSISFRVDTVYGGYASIGGAQLVGIDDLGLIPEPASMVSWLGLFIGLSVLVRRRRS